MRPWFKVDSGGTKRITVPARPQSMLVVACIAAGETEGEVVLPWVIVEPIDSSAASISLLSREISAPANSVGSSAIAASTNSRLVSDFEPGSATVASIGRAETGAGHWE
jgi:hypothetical protein